jgi:hypothetical protein
MLCRTVGELDQDDADVLRRGEDQLAERLRLRLVAPHVGVAADLGHAVDELGHLAAEPLLEHLARGERVLEHVVQQAHRDASFVELELGEQVRDRHRVREVRLPGAPFLPRVLLGGEGVRTTQQGLVAARVLRLEQSEPPSSWGAPALRGFHPVAGSAPCRL